MQITDITIQCKDKNELTGTVFTPTDLKAAVMIAPATGIKRRFYHAFATYLAENGYGVISFENRGIGDSRQGALNRWDASLVSWGSVDMPAVLDKLKTSFPNVSYHLIGHSAGGQLVGLMHNASELQSIFNVAASSGSLTNMHFPFKMVAYFFLNIFIPFNNLLFGFTNSQWLGMGEPLPKTVAAQWSKWCNGKGYAEVDFGHAIQQHWYDKITLPSLWLHASDDDIANSENIKDMLRVYSHIQSEIITLKPKELGYKTIGHMKFFSSKYDALWSYALNWLDQHTTHE